MAPKKCSEENKSKRKAVRATIEVKKDLITKHESGTRVADLATMFRMPKCRHQNHQKRSYMMLSWKVTNLPRNNLPPPPASTCAIIIPF